MPTDSCEFGTKLYQAYVDADPIDPSGLPEVSTEEGYAAQREFVERRKHDEGPVVGYKIGFTNEAVQSELGVSEPSFGQLHAETVRSDRTFETESLIEPMIEPEIAFVLGEKLEKPVSRLDVLTATRAVVPVIEVVDSRIEGWEFTAGTAIADNSLAARLFPGNSIASPERDLTLEGIEVLINGERQATGTGAAVLGHPAAGVAWLARELSSSGETLQAGDIVTTGSITSPLRVSAGDTIVARFASLGTVVVQAT